MNSIERVIKKLILFLFPWRDALGVVLAGVPLRLGEIGAILLGLLPVVHGGKIRIRKSEFFIVWVLLINLIITVLGYSLYYSNLDRAFGLKYIVRNVVFLMSVIGFMTSNISFNDENIDKLVKVFTLIQLVAFVLALTTGIHLYMGTLWGKQEMISSGQFVSFAGVMFPRFAGTCSEAGYLAPLLSIAIYYFLKKYICVKNSNERRSSLIYLLLLLVMTVFTFSTAVYAFAAGVFFITFLRNSQRKRICNILGLALVCFLVIGIIVATNENVQLYLSREVVNKVIIYLSFGSANNVSNWSAMDRTQHIENAIKLFSNSNILQFLIGHGTGAYSDFASRQTTLLVTDVNEAYNLFLSTLTDRGIVGFICLLGVFRFCQKSWIKKDIESTAIFVGIIAQFFHWMLTGNFWLYYFWYEIILLVGIKRDYEGKEC